MPDLEPITFQVSLTRKAHLLAKEFSQKQKGEKERQIYHNTLAVWAVAYYMRCMEIETDCSASDSWNMITQSLLDVADLVLPGIGSLECRPLIQGEQSVYIPLEVSQDRIAYVIVQLDAALEQAEILGFVKTAPMSENLALGSLQPLVDIFKLLEETGRPNSIMDNLINLSNWLKPENTFENNWLALPMVFKSSIREDLALSIRNSEVLSPDNSENSLITASRGKLLNLGIQVKKHRVALVIKITAGQTENTDILVQVYPIHSLRLPEGLKLEIIDALEQTFLQVEARSIDELVQLKFFGRTDEEFSIKLSLGDDSITEYFVI